MTKLSQILMKSLFSGTFWSCWCLSSFLPCFSPCAEKKEAGETNHSPATVIPHESSSQPYLFNTAAIPPHPPPAHFHSCFPQTQALLPLLLSTQGLLADFPPSRKRLKEENPYRLSFQASCASAFSAVTGFMINRHATVSTKVSVTMCWSSGQVDLCLKRPLSSESPGGSGSCSGLLFWWGFFLLFEKKIKHIDNTSSPAAMGR